MLKYSHIEPGQKIRAYDFEPIEGRGPSYVEGKVVAQILRGGAAVLEIIASKDVFGGEDVGSRVGLTVYVPQELFFESDRYERVEVID